MTDKGVSVKTEVEETKPDLDVLDATVDAMTPEPWIPCLAGRGRKDGNGCSCGLLWSVSADVTVASTHVPEDSVEIRPEVNANTHGIAALRNVAKWLIRRARDADRLEAKAKDETGWLIELSEISSGGPQWWTGRVGVDEWTTDSLLAVRFCRRVDAERVASDYAIGSVVVTEHMWCAP